MSNIARDQNQHVCWTFPTSYPRTLALRRDSGNWLCDLQQAYDFFVKPSEAASFPWKTCFGLRMRARTLLPRTLKKQAVNLNMALQEHQIYIYMWPKESHKGAKQTPFTPLVCSCLTDYRREPYSLQVGRGAKKMRGPRTQI